MLYKIDERTWLDLPKWKCREEFVEYFKAKLKDRNDVDTLSKLKERCDEIEKRYLQTQKRANEKRKAKREAQKENKK